MDPDDEPIGEALDKILGKGPVSRVLRNKAPDDFEIDTGPLTGHDARLLNDRYLAALRVAAAQDHQKFSQRKNGRWTNERLIEELDVDEADAIYSPEARDILDERSRICIWCGAVQESLEALDDHEAECGA